MELVRLLHGFDHNLARLLMGLRSSPAWSFVTVCGVVGVGLTLALFISLLDPSSNRHASASQVRTKASLGREELERNHEWSAQDRWRVAHLFVPHKPAPEPKNIQLDSRLVAVPESAKDNFRRWNPNSPNDRQDASRYARRDTEVDVRLELGRPKQAERDLRLVTGTLVDSSLPLEQSRLAERLRLRETRRQVQAEWEFSEDCTRYDYVSLPLPLPTPIRREPPKREPERPRPEPEKIIPLPPIRHEVPQLTIELVEMIRQFMPFFDLPLGSHLVSVSDRSRYPDDELRFQNSLVSYGDQGWKPAEGHHHRSAQEAVPYIGIGRYEPLEHPDSDEFDSSLPSIAEVDLRLELITPHTATPGKPGESVLLVTNEGTDSIARIDIIDSTTHLKTVIDAEPEAMTDQHVDRESGQEEQLLRREIRNLPLGETQELALRWIPEGGHRMFHRTRLIPHAAVVAMTDVVRPQDPDQQMPSIPPEQPPQKHPALAFDVKYLDRVTVGDDLEMAITIRNTGDTALHNVQVKVDLPDQLSHRDGNSLVFDAGNLQVAGRRETILKMSARQAGDAVNVLQVAASESIEAHGRAKIQIVDRPAEKAPVPQPPETPRPKPAIPRNPRPLPPPPSQCCCQYVPSAAFQPNFLIP